jgi:hypothetical protein
LVYGCLCRLSKAVEANLRRKKPQLEFWSFALRGAQIEKIWPWQLHGAQVVLRGAQIADFHPWKLRGAQPNLRGALAQFIQKKKREPSLFRETTTTSPFSLLSNPKPPLTTSKPSPKFTKTSSPLLQSS